MKKLLSVMLKIGFFGFGGGTALIPVIEEAVVKEENLIDEEEFNKAVLVANITPGALPVEIAAVIGSKVSGVKGMILSAVMMALPGALLTVLLVSLIRMSGMAVLSQIMFASAGVTAYIIFMLIEYTRGTLQECKENKTFRWGLLAVLVVFWLTSGTEMFQVLGIDATPLFDISTVNMLMITFFAIFYTRGKLKPLNLIVCGCLIVPYLLCVGKVHLIQSDGVKWALRFIMIILGCYGLFRSMKGRMQFKFRTLKRVAGEVAGWCIFLLLLCIPAFFLFPDTLQFIWNGVISTFLSFGGGDAYLALADGMFVDTNMVSYQDFYQNVVVVANALPGSILCKVLSGVGFVMGDRVGGPGTGYMLALGGFASGVAASGGTAAAVAYIYERFETLEVFRLIKLAIRPIVTGLLLSVCVSMVYQNMSIGQGDSGSLAVVLLLSAGIFVLNLCMKHKTGIRPIYMVIISAGISLISLNIYDILM